MRDVTSVGVFNQFSNIAINLVQEIINEEQALLDATLNEVRAQAQRDAD